jgi:hypothetical protein
MPTKPDRKNQLATTDLGRAIGGDSASIGRLTGVFWTCLVVLAIVGGTLAAYYPALHSLIIQESKSRNFNLLPMGAATRP